MNISYFKGENVIPFCSKWRHTHLWQGALLLLQCYSLVLCSFAYLFSIFNNIFNYYIWGNLIWKVFNGTFSDRSDSWNAFVSLLAQKCPQSGSKGCNTLGWTNKQSQSDSLSHRRNYCEPLCTAAFAGFVDKARVDWNAEMRKMQSTRGWMMGWVSEISALE